MKMYEPEVISASEYYAMHGMHDVKYFALDEASLPSILKAFCGEEDYERLFAEAMTDPDKVKMYLNYLFGGEGETDAFDAEDEEAWIIERDKMSYMIGLYEVLHPEEMGA